MSGLVAYSMTQINTARLSNMRYQQQLLSQSLQNIQASSFSMQSLMIGLDINSPYGQLFRQQLASIHQMETHISLQQQRLNHQIQIAEEQNKSQKKLTDSWIKQAFTYLA